MEKEFIPYEQALALKELGFDEPCFAYFYHHQEYKFLFDNPTQSRDYNSIKVDVGGIFDHDEERVKKGLESLGDSVSRITSIPLYQQVFRWFREKYSLKGFIEVVEYLDETPDTYHWCIFNNCNSGNEQLTYEEAQLECLKKLIEIAKNEKIK